tara:strand:+ start:39 stop:803 length:765 start_codon:yes stop_codon:yes gene_type:complete
MTEQKFPTEFIELPSKGHFYAEDNPLSSGKVEMKYMTAKEEDILTSVNLINQGTVLEKLLEALIVDKTINLDDCLTGDKNALLVGARVLAYGKDYDFEFTDSFGEQVKGKIDLTKLQEVEVDFSKIEKGHNTFSFELPKTKRLLTFQLPTTKMEKEINTEIDAIKKVYNQEDAVEKNRSTRLKHQILSVDGKVDKTYINSFIDNEFLSIDALEFRRYVNSISPDLELKTEVQNSKGGKETATVPITVRFFWPES